MTRNEAVILGLLRQLKRDTGRTKLVKLVYLVDNLRAEHLGDQLSDFSYRWDNYGPNAAGNGIVRSLASLESQGKVRMAQRALPNGNATYQYCVAKGFDSADLPLDADDWQFINAIVKRYGRESTPNVVRASKETLPMRGAERGAALELRQNPEIRDRVKQALSTPGLFERIDESLAYFAAGGKGISLEEARAKYGKHSVA